ncbi:hypothetical protein [Mameliella alba]|uniref:hypothetical protein n=1 Tax=Mameliella alba TaxID=561184 RepID=UPI00179B4EED|nr:hypothetical protein [Mameliella alba]
MTDPKQISTPAATLPQVASAAVVGAGTMGLGIAMASARGGASPPFWSTPPKIG